MKDLVRKMQRDIREAAGPKERKALKRASARMVRHYPIKSILLEWEIEIENKGERK